MKQNLQNMIMSIRQRTIQKKMLFDLQKPQNSFRTSNFDLYSEKQLTVTLGKWLKEQKKSRKQPAWNSLIFNLATLIMPDVQMHQLLISHEFFIDKILCLLSFCAFKQQTLFNGVQIKSSDTFIVFDTQCKLQKVVIEGSQIKQVTPTSAFYMIKRQDLSCGDRKKRLFIYNRQKSQNTIFLTVQFKVLQKIKNELFKEDHFNKMKFFTNYVFGNHCPSFCVSGINMIEIKENQWLDGRIYLNSASVYLIYSGTLVCLLSKTQNLQTEKQKDCFDFIADTKKPSRALSAQRSRRELSSARNQSQSQQFIGKIEMNKGSIIQSNSFREILTKINYLPTQKFQKCKTISHSIIFQIKCSQFYRALCADERCMKYFTNQYHKVLLLRSLILQQSMQALNKFYIQNQQEKDNNQCAFSISRRKNYTGFRTSRSQKSNFEQIQNLSTAEIYDTMIRNKEKVLILQKQYKQTKNPTKQKTYLRYEDNKRIKENYKRMKIKDFQIQKLVFRNSVSNIKDPNGFNNVKSRFGQVKGMFEDQIQQVQNVIKQQRKTMIEEEMNKQNKQFKRKGTKLKSYSPQTNEKKYLKHNLSYSKTYQNSKRVSLNENIQDQAFKQIHEENKLMNQGSMIQMRNSKSTTMIDFKMTMNNMPSMFEFVIEGKREPINFMFNLPKNENEKQVKRTMKKVKTFVKQSQKVLKINPSFNKSLSSLAI